MTGFEPGFQRVGRAVRWLLLGACLSLVLGCASGPQANPQDPLEPMNRQVMRFNDAVDNAVLKPVATTYRDKVPSLIRTGVSNFFGNWRDAWSAANGVLQARPKEAAENFLRFGVNTFLGLGGLLDIASDMGIERTTLDFGLTLARWGVPAGPYVVLPLFGPSSVRDASASFTVDGAGDPLAYGTVDVATRNSLYALRVVDTRTQLLRAGNMLEEASLDRYSFLRDAYLQRRQSLAGQVVPEERYDE
jgi:phospholipid-binding lipoprotein MlaA